MTRWSLDCYLFYFCFFLLTICDQILCMKLVGTDDTHEKENNCKDSLNSPIFSCSWKKKKHGK